MKPLELPEPCPICGKKVFIFDVEEWNTGDSEPIGITYECETEPDIDSDEWPDWFAEHHRMPYVDWLPYEIRAFKWMKGKFAYVGGELRERLAKCPHCGKPATCYGKYADHEEGYACDECCGHGCEDGHCDRIVGDDDDE